jgi:hypothetical protein
MAKNTMAGERVNREAIREARDIPDHATPYSHTTPYKCVERGVERDEFHREFNA